MALIEAQVVTGLAKNILRFAADRRDRIELTAVTFTRPSSRSTGDNQFILAARRLAIPLEVVEETGPFDLSVLAKLRQILEKQKPDVVETHAIKSHFLVSLLRKRQFRWIAFHHGYTSENLKVKFYRQFDNWSLRKCDFITTVCKPFADRMPSGQIQRGRVFVLPNSVKTDFFYQDKVLSDGTRKRLEIAAENQVVLTIGRLSPEKGHTFLIDAVSKVLSAKPHLKFEVLIAGTGLGQQKLKDQISERGVGRYIRLIGRWSDVRPLFAIADLFVLPSLSEGCPNVLLESMAARVPVVATNVGGVPDLVDHGESALLVPPKNSDQLCDSMIELLQNHARAMQLARAAFERASLLFSTATHDDRILDIYDKALRS